MDNATVDGFGSSTAPLTWHDFLERMRHPSAAPFVKDIKSFIVSFLNSEGDGERDSAAVQEFLGNMEAAFRAHTLWAGSSDDELESAGEGLEKYVMTKLFTRVFATLPEDVAADNHLSNKITLVQQFIQPENLDIKPAFRNETSWLLAQKELLKINMYRAPRDKLVCILNCCKVINNLLLNAATAANESPPGADDFLPVLIYVTIKANPPQLHSNLLYIQRYRRQTRLVSESAYFFTNMLSAETFIANIDAKAISMDETEYENSMEYAHALNLGLSGGSDNATGESDQNFEACKDSAANKDALLQMPNQSHESPGMKMKDEEQLPINQLSKTPSISDLENKGAGLLLKEEKVSHVFHEYPFLYSQVGDLTVASVEDLLNQYKEIVFKYVCLCKGLGSDASLVKQSKTELKFGTSEAQENIQDGSSDVLSQTAESLSEHDTAEAKWSENMPQETSQR